MEMKHSLYCLSTICGIKDEVKSKNTTPKLLCSTSTVCYPSFEPRLALDAIGSEGDGAALSGHLKRSLKPYTMLLDFAKLLTSASHHERRF